MKAFSLVELLLIISLVGLLVTISIPSVNNVIQAGKKTKEISALKNLITAYNFYSAENNNKLLKSYDSFGTANDISGNELKDSHEASRWPWRLAPYFNYDFYNTTHVNEAASYIKSQGGLNQTYLVSVIPSFGLSIYCGGNDYEGKAQHMIASNLNQVQKPSQFISFVSSRSMAIGKRYEGFYYVDIPKSVKYDLNDNPKNSGNVSARYNEQAVVAFIGGNVSLISYKELLNKKYWIP